MGAVNNGNTSDNTWNSDVIDAIQTSFIEPWKATYVADSALITPDNLDKMAAQKMRFISRLPETYGLAKDPKKEAWQTGKWVEHKKAAHYKSQSFVKPFRNGSFS